METSLINVKDPVRAFVLEYAAGRGITEVQDNDDLLQTNVVDSLGAFRLIAFLEDTFPLTVEEPDMVPDNFRSLNDIEQFVVTKLRAADGEAVEDIRPTGSATS